MIRVFEVFDMRPDFNHSRVNINRSSTAQADGSEFEYSNFSREKKNEYWKRADLTDENPDKPD